jgi:hypothetical protein
MNWARGDNAFLFVTVVLKLQWFATIQSRASLNLSIIVKEPIFGSRPLICIGIGL